MLVTKTDLALISSKITKIHLLNVKSLLAEIESPTTEKPLHATEVYLKCVRSQKLLESLDEYRQHIAD